VTADPASAVRDADLSDDDALTRARDGDRACYEVLMRRYNQRVYRVVRAILRDDSEVEDVMQETYLAAFCHLGSFESRARFSTWLIRIAINRALDRLRRNRRWQAFDPSSEHAAAHAIGHPDAGAARNPEQQVGARELDRLLEDAIAALPTRYRAAYVLRELEGLETADAAECLGIPAATVKTRVHRARRLLREALRRDLDAGIAEVFRFGGERCDRIVCALLQRI
jgi:RNA polymerase sigma-70 factor (ECF subfamily)